MESDEQASNKIQTVFKEENEEQINEDEKVKKTSSGLDENMAGLLCYLGWFITGIIFLVIEKENRFVRFHAMQSIITSVVLLVVNVIFGIIPIIGWLLGLLLTPFIVVLWAFMMWKAYQGKWFKLPFIGNIVEKQMQKEA